MRLWRKRAVFGISLVIGFLVVMVPAGYDYWKRQPRVPITLLTEEVGLTGQIQVDAIPEIAARGYTTIIDFRPDGEAPDEPSHEAMDAAARANNLGFVYIPVPHGDAVPGDAVTALSNAMASGDKPVLLYCRSGRRAARTWSLVEASRPGGLDAAAIQAAVKKAGHSVEDLGPALDARIAGRTHRGVGR